MKKKHENLTALATCTYLQLGSCNVVPTSYLHVLDWLSRLRASLLKTKQIQEKINYLLLVLATTQTLVHTSDSK